MDPQEMGEAPRPITTQASQQGDEPVYAQASAIGDKATSSDSLGFKLYVEALANFFLAPATSAPLTMSIEGAWGSGKSSFMLQLKQQIATQSPAAVSIDFNAWKYEKQEELWAAFALAVSRTLRAKTGILRRIRGDIRLYRQRFKGFREKVGFTLKLLVWVALLLAFAAGIRWAIRVEYAQRFSAVHQIADDALSSAKPDANTKAQETAPTSSQHAAAVDKGPVTNWILLAIAKVPWLTGIFLVVGLVLKIPDKSRKTLFEIELERYIDKPDYKGKAAFVDAFSDDFTKVVKAYAPEAGAKIFVFIDDLDRCEAPKAADLMHAINLMIGDGSPLFFIIGLDRAKVAASIAFKYREIAPYLLPPSAADAERLEMRQPTSSEARRFGDEFLEKFIQLSFTVPASDRDDLAKQFIDSLIASPAEPAPAAKWHQRLQAWFTKWQKTPAAPKVETAAADDPETDPFRIESGPESERIRQVLLSVRDVLGHNPRRIKTFLNRYRLALYISSRQALLDIKLKTGKAQVTPEQLGKFIALTSTHPDMLDEALANPSFFGDLEFFLIWKRLRGNTNEYVERWLSKPGVRALLQPPSRLTASWERTFSLEDFPVADFGRVLPPIPAPLKKNRGAAPEWDDDEEQNHVETMGGIGSDELSEFDYIRREPADARSYSSDVPVESAESAPEDISRSPHAVHAESFSPSSSSFAGNTPSPFGDKGGPNFRQASPE